MKTIDVQYVQKIIFHPREFVFELACAFPKLFSDKLFLKIIFRHVTGAKLNLCKPRTFNEKLQWLKLYNRMPEYCQMVDKYEVKKYVSNIIGEAFVIPTLAVYNSVEEIDFKVLPEQFVLKCTHDSGGVVICKDKSKLNNEALVKLQKGLHNNFYYKNREWPYKNVKPRIIAERYMEDESGLELKDYKFFCFNGKPKVIQVDYDRFVGHKRNLYDIEWHRLPFTLGFPTDWEREFEKPHNFDVMLDIAAKLSSGYPHIRVDLYNIRGQIYFGELTFFHGSGLEKFTPEEWNQTLGSWIELPLSE